MLLLLAILFPKDQNLRNYKLVKDDCEG